MRYLLVFLLLSSLGWCDEAQQVQMLREVFAQPEGAWLGILRQNRDLLDREFFERVGGRIRWSLSSYYFEDARKFAEVGNLALRVLGRKPRFVGHIQVRPERPAPKSEPLPVRPVASRKAVEDAHAALLLGQVEKAERLFREALVLNPQSIPAWLELAKFHDSQGKSGLAAQAYRHVTRLTPRDGQSWRLRALYLEAQFDRTQAWEALDEARFCYGKAIRLEPRDKLLPASLIRLNSRARVLASQTVDLEGPAAWELQLSKGDRYHVGEEHGHHRFESGDPISGRSNRSEPGEWYPLDALPRESLADYLARSYQPADGAGYDFIHDSWIPDYAFAGGVWRARIVWLRSEWQGTTLWQGERLIGRLGSSIERWPLGTPFARFADRKADLTLQLYRSAMCEIALEVTQGKVDAVYLMEPGRLRANLLRLPRYREL